MSNGVCGEGKRLERQAMTFAFGSAYSPVRLADRAQHLWLVLDAGWASEAVPRQAIRDGVFLEDAEFEL